MLLPDNIKPENSVYYGGAIVLSTLREKDSLELIDLYQAVNRKMRMTFPMLVLCLDWLYLINVAQFNKEGKVFLCS
ncbi:ABC-three component system middle component 6 [Dyadobacter sp. CY326]|uniref:ABC-three component system middle component 6 n=1 Tax=Dyadobacter sp. CY326 TaxID=2907300 RepID=UPI0038D4C027